MERKENESDKIIQEVRENSKLTINAIRQESIDLQNSVMYRIEDCETLVKSRINEVYVKNLGRQIENNIIESFERKNRDTIDQIKDICAELSLKTSSFMDETDATLNNFKSELRKIEKELNHKVSKKSFENY